MIFFWLDFALVAIMLARLTWACSIRRTTSSRSGKRSPGPESGSGLRFF